MSSQDPFLSAQSDVLDLLQQCRPLLQSYLRIRSSASSASSPELVEARRELESTLTDLSADLQDLVDSVRAVEGDPHKFGLDHAEVARRRKLVGEVGEEVEEMRQQLNQMVSAADRKRSASLAHPSTFEDEDPLTGHGDEHGQWEEQRQMDIMHEQDEALDSVFQTVGNLRAQADTMGRELEEQAELLEDTDNIAERVGGKLAKGMKGIRDVLEKNEGESLQASCRTRRERTLTTRHRQMVQLLYLGLDFRLDSPFNFVAGPLMSRQQQMRHWLALRHRSASATPGCSNPIRDIPRICSQTPPEISRNPTKMHDERQYFLSARYDFALTHCRPSPSSPADAA